MQTQNIMQNEVGVADQDETLDLESLNQRYAERLCRVGDNRAPGVVEYIYIGRTTGLPKAKVIMETGGVRHVDILQLTIN